MCTLFYKAHEDPRDPTLEAMCGLVHVDHDSKREAPRGPVVEANVAEHETPHS